MRDKQILEMAKAIEQARIKATDTTNSMNYGFGGWYAKELYNAGYRKIYDDHQRQCTCYALGCQMAESLKTKAAMEAVDDFQRRLRHIFLDMCDGNDYNTLNLLQIDNAIEALFDSHIAELKKKYTESEK